MRKLNQEEEKILSKGIADIQAEYTQGLLPEEEKLLDDAFEDDYPSPGYHIHGEDNPTGMHRHTEDDTIDGAHRHTIMNPEGEHIHGLLEGSALADGKHYHDSSYDLGYHHHKKNDNLGGEIVPESKPDIL